MEYITRYWIILLQLHFDLNGLWTLSDASGSSFFRVTNFGPSATQQATLERVVCALSNGVLGALSFDLT